MTETVLQFLQPYSDEDKVDWIVSPQMDQYTSFRIGGLAKLLVYPKSEEVLIALIEQLKKLGEKYIVLGRMTNLVFSDSYYNGVIICTSKLKELYCTDMTVTASCGVTLSELCRFCREADLTGHEFAYGIPGTVGGAVFMNAGAYGGVMADILTSVTYYDASNGRINTVSARECAFSYRSSVFRANTNQIILRAEFDLKRGEGSEIQTRMDEILQKRIASQPLDYPNAGSIFKRNERCIVSKLLDELGLKGLRVGDAMISEKHAGFIVNVGKATAADVRALIQKIKNIVYERQGIELEEEILYIE